MANVSSTSLVFDEFCDTGFVYEMKQVLTSIGTSHNLVFLSLSFERQVDKDRTTFPCKILIKISTNFTQKKTRNIKLCSSNKASVRAYSITYKYIYRYTTTSYNYIVLRDVRLVPLESGLRAALDA